MNFSYIMIENSQSRHKLSSIPTPLKATLGFSEASKASGSRKKRSKVGSNKCHERHLNALKGPEQAYKSLRSSYEAHEAIDPKGGQEASNLNFKKWPGRPFFGSKNGLPGHFLQLRFETS